MPNTYADDLRDLARMLDDDFKRNILVCVATAMKAYNDAYPDPPTPPKSYADDGKSKGEATFIDGS